MRAWVEVPARTPAGPASILVDVDDYLAIGGRRLSLASHGYAQITPYGAGKTELLHRWILGLRKGDGLIGDHRNGDPRDYRRSNLRIVDPSGSSQNVSGRGTSRFRGVYPQRGGRWAAAVKFRGVIYSLGTFSNERDAARAADIKRRELMPDYVPRPADVAELYGGSRDLSELVAPKSDQRARRLPTVIEPYLQMRGEGLSRREIAARLGMTPGALKLALRRAALAGDTRVDYQLRSIA